MKKLALILFAITLFSCNLKNREPEFKTVENIKVEKFSLNNISITADAVVYNPNGVSIFLNKTEIDVFADGNKVSHISQTQHTEITKKSDFKIPLKANFKLKDLLGNSSSLLGMITSGLNALENKEVTMKYVGSAEFKLAGITFSVPVEYEEKISLKQ